MYLFTVKVEVIRFGLLIDDTLRFDITFMSLRAEQKIKIAVNRGPETPGKNSIQPNRSSHFKFFTKRKTVHGPHLFHLNSYLF